MKDKNKIDLDLEKVTDSQKNYEKLLSNIR